MSDFLTRLAERTLGLAATIEPRLPGTFGPIEDPPHEIASPVAAMERAARHEVVPWDAPRTPTDRGPHESEPHRVPGPRARSNATALLRPSDVAIAPNRATRPAGIATTGNDAIGRDPRERLAPSDSSIVERAAAMSASETAGRRAAARALTRRDRLVPIVRASAPDVLPPPDVSAPGGERGAAPVVRISIGRVEVQASVTGPSRPERVAKREARSRVSLADYLKNGGAPR